MPRLVRRRPLLERIKAYLNPLDFLLWLSEELETRDWDNKTAVTPFALSFHFVFLIARANSASSATKDDDVFGDPNSGTGWLTYFANITVFFLTFLSVGNAAYTFLRKRHYRLFESNIETPQSTPSAHRVKVDSSPVSSSPLRFMQNILGDTSAESRAHPDPTRDVWELAVWDPIPVCLRLFCLFSPGHVLVYWLFLPTQSSDPHPSLAVFRTIFLQALLTAQLLLLQLNFSQQTKDTSVIHKEVLSEYDIKYVHPRLNPLVRDVGTQFSEPTAESDAECEIDTYTPTILLKRTFQTNPNPNYAKHIDPENTGAVHQRIYTPSPPFTTPSTTGFQPHPVKTPNTAIRQPQFRKSVNTAVSTGTSTGTSTGDGGSLGIYSHANSPLKKHSSMYDLNRQPAPRNSFAMAAREISEDRERSRSRSPAKRESSIHRSLYRKEPQHPESAERRSSTPTGFSNARIQGAERGPSRW